MSQLFCSLAVATFVFLFTCSNGKKSCCVPAPNNTTPDARFCETINQNSTIRYINLCQNEGSCAIDGCGCRPNYTGEFCEIHKQRDKCSSNPCVHGKCLSDISESYKCQCESSWTGVNCEAEFNTSQDHGPNVILTIRPVRFENHGEMDLHGRACSSKENCEVRIRYCYAILPSTTTNLSKHQDFCKYAVTAELHPFTEEFSVSSGGPAYYSHNFHMDENSQTRFLYHKNRKLAIWFDASHYISSVDPIFNETRTEHRMIGEKYHEIEIAENLLPNEDTRTFKLFQNTYFEGDFPRYLHGWIEFTFRAEVKCLHFWRGCTCQKFCMPGEKYRCDGNGNHVCNFPWYTPANPRHPLDDCSKKCKAHDPGMYCTEHGEYKCFEGYQPAQGNSPSEFIPCDQVTCENSPIGCPAALKCVDSAEYNDDRQGFYKCE